MPIVRLGNSSARESVTVDDPSGAVGEDGRVQQVKTWRELPGDQVTTIIVPNDRDLSEAFTEITAAERGAWHSHSSGPPTWVESDDKALEYLLASHFQCPVRDAAVAESASVEPEVEQ